MARVSESVKNSEVSEVQEKSVPFDLDSGVLLFPVRHHSPVCSYQLIKTIELYKPEIILIEGPENANSIIPALTHPDTVLPVAFYYFYKDTGKLVSEEAEDYKCYYPFIYSSPEYNAVKEAEKLGIPAKFIDLPYCDILINTSENSGLRKKADRHSYADDSHIVGGKFHSAVCEKTGVRNFDEFWEKYFEIAGLELSPEEFVHRMHTYCIITREMTSSEELIADGTVAREDFMASNIKKFSEEYKKILVVTGGFHSYGIYERLSRKKLKAPRTHKIPEKKQGCYPMAYSYPSADALRGYASGMNFPYFCDCITKSLQNGTEPCEVYNEQSLDFLVRTAKRSSKKNIPVSTADVISAKSLMTGLSALRNCRQCGTFELFDGVTSAFIKGEKTVSSSIPLDILAGLASGDGAGKIGDKSHIPPLVADFENLCTKYKLKYQSASEEIVEIPLFTKPKSTELSRFMHRMDFLGTAFGRMTKGPDLHRNTDRNRVREEWKYRRSPQVDSALIDHTTDGFTIEEACREHAGKILTEKRRCEDASYIAVECFLMGIPLSDEQKILIDRITAEDGDFFSVGRGLKQFEMLCRLKKLYQSKDSSPEKYLERCFSKLVSAIPSMANVPEEKADECSEIIRSAYSTVQDILTDWIEPFRSSLETLVSSPEKEPSVYGVCTGLLYAMDSDWREQAETAVKGYLNGSPETKKKGAGFLKGLFSSARDIVLNDDSFLNMIDSLITSLEYDDFMEILPSLRLAFSYFTPNEIQTTAEKVSKIYSSDGNILREDAVDESLFLFGESLDRKIVNILNNKYK